MIEFVRSSENDSDIFTKNVTSETFSRHSEKLTWTKEEFETEAETRILSTGRVLKGIEYHFIMGSNPSQIFFCEFEPYHTKGNNC